MSLPEDIVKNVKRVSHESGLKVSQIVARALERQFGEQSELPAEGVIYPTALWKLKGRKSLKAPSPRLNRKHVGSWRIIDLDDIPI